MRKQVYRIEVTAQTLWVSVTGTSNRRTTEAYVADFRQAAQTLITRSWACVLDLRSWLPSPHEAFALLQDNTRWCYAHGLSCVVVILPTDSFSVWQYLKATEVEHAPQILRHKVAEPAQAQDFLRQHGYWL